MERQSGALAVNMTVKHGKQLELIPLQHCLWCLSTDHLLEQCAEKHNLFALTGNDEAFLRQCGIWFPRWIDNRFVVDPYEREEIQ
jgi:hypothetical protein